MNFFTQVVFLFAATLFPPFVVAIEPKQSLIQWIDADIETQRRRREILVGTDYSRIGPDGQAASVIQVAAKIRDDVNFLDLRILKLQELRNKLQRHDGSQANANQISQDLAQLGSPCDLNSCLQLLGSVNEDLAAQIADITNHIVITEWDSFRVEKKTSLNDEDGLSEIASLTTRRWACERSVAKFEGEVKMHTAKMGRCLAAVAKEEAAAQGLPLSRGLQRSHFDVPQVVKLNLSEDVKTRLTNEIEKLPDFQATPWDVFRLCARESKGQLAVAIDYCYQVLRINRVRTSFTRKLMDIRGDRYRGGDNSGDWYHFFGMARAGAAYGRSVYLGYHYFSLFVDNMESSEKRNDLAGARVGITMSNKIFPIGVAEVAQNFAMPLKSSSEECQVESIFDHHANAQ